jgi:hypothetical protein
VTRLTKFYAYNDVVTPRTRGGSTLPGRRYVVTVELWNSRNGVQIDRPGQKMASEGEAVERRLHTAVPQSHSARGDSVLISPNA